MNNYVLLCDQRMTLGYSSYMLWFRYLGLVNPFTSSRLLHLCVNIVLIQSNFFTISAVRIVQVENEFGPFYCMVGVTICRRIFGIFNS